MSPLPFSINKQLFFECIEGAGRISFRPMVMQIKNQFTLHLWIFILLCLVFSLSPSSVSPQILSNEGLGSLKGQPNHSSKKTEDKSGLSERTDIEYKAANFRDPFEPQLFISEKEAEKEVKVAELIEPIMPRASELFSLSIQGIIWNSDNPVAIINNKVLKMGEVLLIPKGENVYEQITITDIDKDGVTISYSGKVEKLPSPAISKSKKQKEEKK